MGSGNPRGPTDPQPARRRPLQLAFLECCVSRPAHDLADLFRRLGSVPVSRQTVRTVVADLAKEAAPVLGVEPAASLTLVADGPARTVAASVPLAKRLDAVQYREGAGPCLEAARGGAPVSTLSGHDDRWPVFARALATARCDSVWSHPLPEGVPAAGSVNIYLPAGVHPDRREAAAALAEKAAVPVANVWLYEEAVRTAENLRLALESRAVIEQAKGILMERLRVTPDGAFEILARISNDTNTKLRDVAQAVADTGSVPPEASTRRSPAPR
jgi:ANTAR domain